MSGSPATRSRQLGDTLGTGRDVPRRLLLHHVPLALASSVVLVLFLALPIFDPSVRPHADITSGTVPVERAVPMDHENHQGRPNDMDHGPAPTEPAQMDHRANRSEGPTLRFEPTSRLFKTQLTVATGYVALGLLALTLLLGPINLILRRRNPVSSYLRRDVGTWTAIYSVVHVVLGLQAEKVRSGLLAFVDFFVADGRPLTNSFGWGNWTGLAALVIIVGLLAISTDRSIRELKARRWKNLQRLNYALFALVVAHAFFYGAFMRMTSPSTLLLIVTAAAVLTGQAVGVSLWRRRHPRGRDDHRGRESTPAAR